MTKRPFDPGDIARCDVGWYSSAQKEQHFVVTACRPYKGSLIGERSQWVIEVEHPWFGTTAYMARNFKNMSRKEPLLYRKEEKMPKDEVYLVLPMIDCTANAPNVADAIRNNQIGVCDTFNDAEQKAKGALATGPYGSVVVFRAVAVVEPVPNTRTRSLL